MFITVAELSRYWKISPSGVLHVGAHLAEEALDYEKYRWTPVIWIEAQPNLVQELNLRLDVKRHKVIEAAIWDEDNVELKLHVASSSQSTSLLDFGSHLELYPDISFISEIDVSTKRLDSVIEPHEMPNFINLDIQGVELAAIRSLGNLLLSVDYIYTEVNKNEVYKGGTLVADLDSYLMTHGFKRVATRWYFKEGWGDALYIRKTKFDTRSLLRKFTWSLFTSKFYLRQLASSCKKYLFAMK